MNTSDPKTGARALVERIHELKKSRRAIIIAHNYQNSEIQDVADFVGDSLELSCRAARTDAEVLLFCGVHFMAETAAILCPDKTVLLPDPEAGCSMSDMLTADELRTLKAKHPDAVVVCYVNSSAEVKAESDICCTSSNAAAVVRSIPADRKIIFVPDQYLGSYIARETGRDLILHHGYCPTHFRILAADIETARAAHPGAEVVVHPECTPDVIGRADQVLSTSGICNAVRNSSARDIIVGTEVGILHRLRKENPEKRIHAGCAWCDCSHMKVNTLEKILWSLEDLQYVVRVDEPIRTRALRAVRRMMEISR